MWRAVLSISASWSQNWDLAACPQRSEAVPYVRGHPALGEICASELEGVGRWVDLCGNPEVAVTAFSLSNLFCNPHHCVNISSQRPFWGPEIRGVCPACW